jgi:hypothetical protein
MIGVLDELGPSSESVNLMYTLRLRPEVREHDVLEAVRSLVESFEALRTVYLPGPAQRVLRTGELTVPVIEAGRDAGPAACDMATAMWSIPFDTSGEWPVRLALVTAAGRPRCLVLVACHLAVDRIGATSIRHHLRAVLAQPPAEVQGAVHAPLDEVEWEQSAAGRRHAEHVVRQHSLTYQVVPQTMLPRAVSGGPPRYRFQRFDSPALETAVATLSGRHGASPAAVLAAGVCAVAGFAAGLDRAFLLLTVRNGVQAGMHTQDVPFHLDLAGAGMAELIGRAEVAVTRAARLGHYPPAELAARRRAIEIERGVAFDSSLRLDAGEATLMYDSAVLPQDEARGWAASVERLLRAAAAGEVGAAEIGAHTELVPVVRGVGWCLAERSWVHLPSVADLVGEVAGVRRVAVFRDPVFSGGNRLVAFLEGGVDIPWLHAGCVNALPGRRTVIAPHRYVVCARRPEEPGIAGWQRLPVLAEGTGRPVYEG